MMAATIDVGSLARELGVEKLSPSEVTVVCELALREAVKLVSKHGLKAQEVYEHGQAVPLVRGDFYLNFGPYMLRVRIPRENIPIVKPASYKAINEFSH